MGTSRQKSTTSQVDTRTPYGPAQQGIESAANGITNWLNNPSSAQPYTGPRVAQISDQTRAGLNEYGAATGARQARDFYSGIIGQSMGADNPYLQQLQRSITSSVLPSVNAQFSNAGLSGSTLHQGAVTQGLTNALAPTLFNAFEAERGRQLQAASALPGVDERIGQRGVEAGQIGEGYDQRNIDAGVAAFNEQKNAGLYPYATATPLLGTLGSLGGTSTSKGISTQSSNPGLGQTLLGAGLTGASLFARGGLSGLL